MKPILRLPVLLLPVLLLAAASPAVAEEDGATRLLRFPDIHRDFVVFVYGGDLWRAPSAGGEARRLTAHPGLELFPKISPDGELVAFTAETSGSRQVWVMPSEGGTPRQLTFYTDVGRMPPRGGWDYWIQGWSPEGKILVRMNRTPWGERMGRYFLVDPDGGLEEPLPLPEGGSASFSPDGKRLAYCPISREFRTWKRTRGGRAQDVWIFDLEALQSERLTTDPGTDNFPLWAGDTVYFTSDRGDGGATLNLFALDLMSRDLRQVTDFEEFDVLWPSLGPEGRTPEAIVFMNGGELHRFDLATGETRRIPIRVRSELPLAVPRFVDVASNVRSASLSPSGARAAFDARGEIFTVPAEKGPTRNLSRTQGVREIDPAWSPDGEWIAYLSHATGEYEIYVRPQDGSGEPRQLTRGGTVWRLPPVWSPDSRKIAFGDRQRRLYVLDVASEELTEVDTGTLGDLDVYAFSPDSRWLVYEKPHPTRMPGLWLYSLADGRTLTLGDGLTADFGPAWSADGKHLFFLSRRDFQPRFSAFEFNYLYDRATRVYAAALDPEAPALFPPESDEEEGTKDEEEDGEDGEGNGEGKKDRKGKKDAKDEATEPLSIEAAGFVARTVALPGLEAGNYARLQAADGAVFYLHSADGPPRDLYRYDLEKRKAELVLSTVDGYELSADGEKLLYRSGDAWGIADAKPGMQNGEGKLDLAGLRVKLDPRAEWRQIFDDAWRITRDWFYDPEMHGVDWRSMRQRYGALVPHVAHRGELDFLFGEMLGELEAGHTYVGSGDEPEVERVAGGMLGCELETDPSGAFRIARIFPGENWHPDYRSPLTEPGVDVREGEYLLAIDGVELRHPDNPYRLLENKAGAQVALTVASEPSIDEARQVTVRPVASELDLRYLAWVRERMAMTERLSGGRVGYIHLPDTSFAGNRMLQKLFYSQVDKEALIIDDRYNGGGFIPDRMIEVLSRTTLAWWARRDIEPFSTPGFAHDGPKVMLINGYSASGGDALPYFFRKRGLGPLVGTRTWGGLIGLTENPDFVDGGNLRVPTFRIYDEEGRWVVENEGVAPDVEVVDLPEAVIAGRDPSLEKGVELLLEALAAEPVEEPAVPEPPDMTR